MRQNKYCPIGIAKTSFFWAQFCEKLRSKLRHLGRRAAVAAAAVATTVAQSAIAIASHLMLPLSVICCIRWQNLCLLSLISLCNRAGWLLSVESLATLSCHVVCPPNDDDDIAAACSCCIPRRPRANISAACSCPPATHAKTTLPPAHVALSATHHLHNILAPGFLVLFLERSKNRTLVFGSITGTFSETSQICDSLFYVHDRAVIFWYPRQYAPTVDCMAGTCCACGLGFCPWYSLRSWLWLCLGGLTVLVAPGFVHGTPFTHGLGIHPQDLLCSWLALASTTP